MAERAACLRTRLALRRKPVSSASKGSRTGLRSRLKGDCAMEANALTAVSRVISLRSRSNRTYSHQSGCMILSHSCC